LLFRGSALVDRVEPLVGTPSLRAARESGCRSPACGGRMLQESARQPR